ncbi:hypothetical protein [Alistipes communis]|uniref:hypothetical protein n=1 Tax=Alistipes communis TaxID=2585118 RepID=UPI003AACCCD0
MIHRSERYAPSRPEYNKIYELHLPNPRPTESACGHDAFVRDSSVALHACFHSERTHRYLERYAPSRPEYNKIYELHLPNRRPAESACGHDACARDAFVCNVFVRNTLVRSTFVRNSLGALRACFHSERTHRYPERYASSRPEYNKIYELHLPNRRSAESACGHDAFVCNGSVALHAPPILQAAASPCFFFK